MLTEKAIKKDFKSQHDILSNSYYAGESGLTKKEFDIQHALIWDNMEVALTENGHIIPGPAPRDLAKELDSLKARIDILEGPDFR